MPKKKKKSNHKVDRSLIKIGRHTHEVTTVHDQEDKLLHKIVKPLMLEFHPKDVVQVIVGASLLALPLAYTEEVWHLGRELSPSHIFGIIIVSLLFTGVFTFYTYYKRHFASHSGEFFKRVISTYLISLVVVAIILLLIDRAPLLEDPVLMFNRMVLLAFPASMSATVADMLK